MDIDHDTLVGFAKSFGLFYLIALVDRRARSTPTGRRTRSGSTGAAKTIIDDEDKPWR